MLSARAARARAASYATLRSAYFWSCAVYAAYAIGILRIDFCSPASSPDCSASAVNAAYTGWGVVHLINALQYLTSWLQAGVPLRRLRVTAPDWGNVLGAMLYLASAAGYGDVEKEGPGGPAAARGRRLELAASLVEVAAAYGWTRVWLDALPAGAAALGRGMVLSDPDAWGNALIVLPSFIYLLYNAQITADPAQYGARARVRGVRLGGPWPRRRVA